MGLKEKLSLVFLLALLTFLPTQVTAATPSDIAKQLVCQCGCTSTLNNCVHGECTVRDTMYRLIEQQLANGKSEAEVIQFFVAQYGEQVLASPPKQGFNLVAWITPFAALLLGGGIIYLALKRWVKRGSQTPSPAETEIEETDKEYQHRLEKELADFRERSFR